jgi:hypothetical protein
MVIQSRLSKPAVPPVPVGWQIDLTGMMVACFAPRFLDKQWKPGPDIRLDEASRGFFLSYRADATT